MQLLRQMILDPNAQRNEVLLSSTTALNARAGALGFYELDEIVGFWAFTGEMVGELWKPILAQETSFADAQRMLDNCQFNAGLATADDTGIGFNTSTPPLFCEATASLKPCSLEKDLRRVLEDYAQFVLVPFFGAGLIREFNTWADRATARFLDFYHNLALPLATESADERSILLSHIARCYIANVRLRAIIIEMCFVFHEPDASSRAAAVEKRMRDMREQ